MGLYEIVGEEKVGGGRQRGEGPGVGLLTLPACVHLASRAISISSSAHHGVLHSGAPVGATGADGIAHGGQVSLLQGLGQLAIG